LNHTDKLIFPHLIIFDKELKRLNRIKQVQIKEGSSTQLEEELEEREAEKGVHTFSHLFVLNKELKQLNSL
jgi:hypothetical protein